jgi:hypothetical protein
MCQPSAGQVCWQTFDDGMKASYYYERLEKRERRRWWQRLLSG